MNRLAIVLLLSVGCASSSTPAPSRPDWKAIPASVVEAFCIKLNEEAVAKDGPVAIVTTTQPLVTVANLKSLSQAYFKARGNQNKVAEALLTTEMLPIHLAAGGCSWQPIESIVPARDLNTIIVEISPVIPNPFAKKEAGLFARLSLGGHNANLYWIPVGYRNTRWGLGRIVPIQ